MYTDSQAQTGIHIFVYGSLPEIVLDLLKPIPKIASSDAG